MARWKIENDKGENIRVHSNLDGLRMVEHMLNFGESNLITVTRIEDNHNTTPPAEHFG